MSRRNHRTVAEQLAAAPFTVRLGGEVFDVPVLPLGPTLAWQEALAAREEIYKDHLAAGTMTTRLLADQLRDTAGLVFDYLKLGEAKRAELMERATAREFNAALLEIVKVSFQLAAS